MSKGITQSCAYIWRGIARAGGWWSVQRVVREWDGVFSLADIEEYLATLKCAGFLVAMQTPSEGTVYAFTPDCLPLPGSNLRAVPSTPPPLPNVAPARQVQVMFGPVYVPPRTQTFRPGSMDYAQVPSLHMGQRRAFRSKA